MRSLFTENPEHALRAVVRGTITFFFDVLIFYFCWDYLQDIFNLPSLSYADCLVIFFLLKSIWPQSISNTTEWLGIMGSKFGE